MILKFKMPVMTAVCAISLLLLPMAAGNAAGTGDAAGGGKSAEKDQGAPAAFFPKPTHTFDPVVEGKEVVRTFTLKNRGDKVLEVQKVKTG